jgi:hypothetical protein
MDNILPKEIRDLRQWSISYNTEELKRPLHTKYPPHGGLTMDEAITKASDNLLTGLYVSDEDPYILGDIDHVDNPEDVFKCLTDEFAYFLKTNKTYMEVSPSGHGIRFILQLPDKVDKKALAGNVFYLRDSGGDSKNSRQINVRPPWMTITRNPISCSVNRIAIVTLEQLDEIFELKYKGVDVKTQIVHQAVTLPAMSEIELALRTLPLDKNPRIKRAYKRVVGHEYEHYDYWLKVIMSVHHFSKLSNSLMEGFEMVLVWSEKDTEAFESEEDLMKHWRSFDDQNETSITFKTLFKLLYAYILVWPAPKAQTKMEKEVCAPKKPLITEYVNFRALIDHYGIRLYRSENNTVEMYMTGDTDILNEFFIMYRVSVHYDEYYGPYDHNTLVPAFHMFLQKNGFIGISHGKVSEFLKNFQAETKDTVNLIEIYFNTPFDELPTVYQENSKFFERSTFEYLYSCLDVELTYAGTEKEDTEAELYKTYYKCWLMGLVRTIFFRDTKNINNCVLLLTGKEQIRKTSHFMYLLPSFMRDNIAFTTHGFDTDAAIRDVSKIAMNSLVVVWDEVERYLTSKTESNFKKLIDSVPQKVVDKYQVLESTITPKAIFGATSNQKEFKLSGMGSRRLFHIPVSWVDTDKMDRVCWWRLINDLRAECQVLLDDGIVPWLLDEDELELQTKLHHHILSKTSVDLMLEEVFEFDTEFDDMLRVTTFQSDKSKCLLTTKQVLDTMSKYGYNVTHVNRKGVENALEVACSHYTSTVRGSKEIASPVCTIKKGRAWQGRLWRWVMPPLNSNMLNGVFEGIHE